MPHRASGEVVEWLMALVLKTSEVKASAGSNPALSVPMTSVLKEAVGAHDYSGLRAGAVQLPFEVGYALLPQAVLAAAGGLEVLLRSY